MEEKYIGVIKHKSVANIPNHILAGNEGLIYRRKEDGSYLCCGRTYSAEDIQHDIDTGCLKIYDEDKRN